MWCCSQLCSQTDVSFMWQCIRKLQVTFKLCMGPLTLHNLSHFIIFLIVFLKRDVATKNDPPFCFFTLFVHLTYIHKLILLQVEGECQLLSTKFYNLWPVHQRNLFWVITYIHRLNLLHHWSHFCLLQIRAAMRWSYQDLQQTCHCQCTQIFSNSITMDFPTHTLDYFKKK